MGLFSFFKKKKTVSPEDEENDAIANLNIYLLDQLEAGIAVLNYPVTRSDDKLFVIVNNTIRITAGVMDAQQHSQATVLHLRFLTFHPEYYPKGIEDNLAGIGQNLALSCEEGVKNYLISIFPAIMESLQAAHYPSLNINSDNQLLWHTIPGSLVAQGKWLSLQENEVFFNQLKIPLQAVLQDQPFNWLKIYANRMPDGDINIDCLLNNEPWEEGTQIVHHFVEYWPQPGDFLGLKQFLVFRRCA